MTDYLGFLNSKIKKFAQDIAELDERVREAYKTNDPHAHSIQDMANRTVARYFAAI